MAAITVPPIQIPALCAVQRRLPSGEPVDLAEAITREWQQLGLTEHVKGKKIAIGVGSRGVAGVEAIARQIATLVRKSGGEPFIVPAMGCHGGATSEGQREVLRSLGVTEKSAGCPIRATMDTVTLGETERGFPVYVDRFVAEADGLIIANRVALHTDFRDKTESGLLKMLSIGLGKERGAALIHSHGVRAVRDYRAEVAAVILQHINFVAGFATVEDGYNRPVHLEALPAENLVEDEARLLDMARSLKPRLPADDIDVLIVDLMGKEISGTGMDTNVIGRRRVEGHEEFESPRIKAVVVLDLSNASHGNATGVGLADFITRRLLDKIDFAIMTKNIFTSGFLQRGRIPLVFATNAEAIDAALNHVFRANPQDRHAARVMRIRSTRELEDLWVSPSLLEEVKNDSGFIKAGEPQELVFDEGALR